MSIKPSANYRGKQNRPFDSFGANGTARGLYPHIGLFDPENALPALLVRFLISPTSGCTNARGPRQTSLAIHQPTAPKALRGFWAMIDRISGLTQVPLRGAATDAALVAKARRIFGVGTYWSFTHLPK